MMEHPVDRNGDTHGESATQAPQGDRNESIWDRCYKKLQNAKITIKNFFSVPGMMEMRNRIKRNLVPEGYPQSVSKDYLVHQFFYLTHIFFSTIAGILATQEVFYTFGYGFIPTYPLAATLTWIYKDGFGQFAKIMFRGYQGHRLDMYSKRIYMYSQFFLDMACCIEMCMSMFGNWALIFLGISTILRTTDGISKATRLSMTARFALRGNKADVNAKETSQSTAVKFLASVVTLFCLGRFETFGRQVIFFVTIILHMVLNYMSVRALCLRTVNEGRCLTALRSFLMARRPQLAPVAVAPRRESVLASLKPFTPEHVTTFRIKVVPRLPSVLRPSTQEADLQIMNNVYRNQVYMLYPNLENRVIYIVVAADKFAGVIVTAYLHALLLAMFICAINNVPLPIFNDAALNFRTLIRTLSLSEWPRTAIRYPANNGLQFEPSEALHLFALNVSRTEWSKMFQGVFDAAEEWRARYTAADARASPEPTVFNTFDDALAEAIARRQTEAPGDAEAPDDTEAPGDTDDADTTHVVEVVPPVIEPRPRQRTANTVIRRHPSPDERISRLDTPTPERRPRPRRV